jgi:hypothetical protein
VDGEGQRVQRKNDWPGQKEGKGGGDLLVYIDDCTGTFEDDEAYAVFMRENATRGLELTENGARAMIGFRLRRTEIEIDGMWRVRTTMDGETFTRKILDLHGHYVEALQDGAC